jgi:hypothetical protein
MHLEKYWIPIVNYSTRQSLIRNEDFCSSTTFSARELPIPHYACIFQYRRHVATAAAWAGSCNSSAGVMEHRHGHYQELGQRHGRHQDWGKRVSFRPQRHQPQPQPPSASCSLFPCHRYDPLLGRTFVCFDECLHQVLQQRRRHRILQQQRGCHGVQE